MLIDTTLKSCGLHILAKDPFSNECWWTVPGLNDWLVKTKKDSNKILLISKFYIYDNEIHTTSLNPFNVNEKNYNILIEKVNALILEFKHVQETLKLKKLRNDFE